MSDTSQGPGWWQASDGKWYPPEAQPGSAQPGAAQPGQAAGGQAGYGGAPGGGFTPAGAQPGGSVGIGDAFNYGWLKFQQNVGPILIALVASVVVAAILGFAFIALTGAIFGDSGFIVSTIISMLVFAVVSVLVQMAIIRGSLFITEGRPLDLKEMFDPDQIGPYLIAGLIVAVAAAIGSIVIIGGLIVMFFCQYFGYFLIDKKLSPIDSIKASINFVNQNLGTLIGFYIGTMIAHFIGALLCGVGLLVAIPVVVIAQAFMYRRLQGEPVV